MSDKKEFIFKGYFFDQDNKELSLNYSIDSSINFTEKFVFNFDYKENIDLKALEKAFQGLFFMAGVSYFKTYLPTNIIIEAGQLSQDDSDFFSRTYTKGLGEFFLVNRISPLPQISFPIDATTIQEINLDNYFEKGYLIGLGGGKDSIVTAELLRETDKAYTWSLNHGAKLAPLVRDVGLPHFQVSRSIDPKLIELNENGALNGHVPISAIIAFTGLIVSLLTGISDVVVSNENAANEANTIYEGMEINHQYSKSLDFEIDFQKYIKRNFGTKTSYYSSLRPYSELIISKYFSSLFNKYKYTFSSCNRAFTSESKNIYWCGECPKCCFTFLILSPYVESQKLEELWGKNLLLDTSLEKTYMELLGISGIKPLDCVGEIAETRYAMELAQEKYIELSGKYTFEVNNFSINQMFSHSMPKDVLEITKSSLLT
jgi:hypothetical protein